MKKQARQGRTAWRDEQRTRREAVPGTIPHDELPPMPCALVSFDDEPVTLAVANPANALSSLLAALVDERGQIQLPGFYQDVVPLTDQEREMVTIIALYTMGWYGEQKAREPVGQH